MAWGFFGFLLLLGLVVDRSVRLPDSGLVDQMFAPTQKTRRPWPTTLQKKRRRHRWRPGPNSLGPHGLDFFLLFQPSAAGESGKTYTHTRQATRSPTKIDAGRKGDGKSDSRRTANPLVVSCSRLGPLAARSSKFFLLPSHHFSLCGSDVAGSKKNGPTIRQPLRHRPTTERLPKEKRHKEEKATTERGDAVPLDDSTKDSRETETRTQQRLKRDRYKER